MPKIAANKLKRLLHPHFTTDFSQHDIARSIRIAVGSVHKYIKLAHILGLSWPLTPQQDKPAVLHAMFDRLTRSKPKHPYKIDFK